MAGSPRRTSRRLRRLHMLALMLALGLVSAACGGADGTGTAEPAAAGSPAEGQTAESPEEPSAETQAAAEESQEPQELRPASLRLDWSYLPNHIPFLYAKDMGYYEEVGIDLEIKEGEGSGNAVLLVGNNNDTFAYASTDPMVLSRNEGLPVKSIMVLQRRNSNATVCYEEVGFDDPKDLEGRSVIMPPGGASAIMFPAYLEVNDADMNAVNIINADTSSALTLFLEGRSDCYVGQYGNDTLRAGMLNEDIGEAIAWVDHGVGLVGHSIVANESTLQEDPELARDFLKATVRAWTEICEDPSVGAEFYIENYPEQNEDEFWQNYTRLSMPLECEKTLPAEGDPGEQFGPMDEDYFNQVLDFHEQYAGLTNRQPASEYYTNEFLPSS